MAFEFTASDIINIFAFLGLTISTYTIFYFGRQIGPRKGVNVNLFALALGINLIGLSHLFRIWFETVTSLILVTVGVGSALMVIGVLLVFREKRVELYNLKTREEEIKSVIAKLKDKYYQQELSEEDLKSSYSGLLRELAEIEVKISGKEVNKIKEK